MGVTKPRKYQHAAGIGSGSEAFISPRNEERRKGAAGRLDFSRKNH
ncbi:hypothetical protein HMPREF1986_00618 [Oribacterium sp. oral taxon 078 str. F0263]|nr:hypothetical protein HMPREF1986_00618 [Oribacterium sp. oral taxon 078 str. F0263]